MTTRSAKEKARATPRSTVKKTGVTPVVRPCLKVHRTTLVNPKTKKRYTFNGLFTTKALKKGDFLGYYNGKFVRSTRSLYAFQLTRDFGFVTPPLRKDSVPPSPDPAAYPLAMANEPPQGSSASIHVKEFTRAKSGRLVVVPGIAPSTKIAAIGFYASKNIKRGDELFLHYGEHYPRSHYIGKGTEVGGHCSHYLLAEEMQSPADMMKRYGLLDHLSTDCYTT